jgi:hypothetical protein
MLHLAAAKLNRRSFAGWRRVSTPWLAERKPKQPRPGVTQALVRKKKKNMTLKQMKATWAIMPTWAKVADLILLALAAVGAVCLFRLFLY